MRVMLDAQVDLQNHFSTVVREQLTNLLGLFAVLELGSAAQAQLVRELGLLAPEPLEHLQKDDTERIIHLANEIAKSEVTDEARRALLGWVDSLDQKSLD